jgi:predicted RNA binding protein YcfA (HicA-like mRNA interferase family)
MRLLPITRSDLIKRLRVFGWEGPASGKRHEYMYKGNVPLIIPNPHGSKEISVNLLKVILQQAGISREEWIRRR